MTLRGWVSMLRKYNDKDMQETLHMIREFFNHHRKLHDRDDCMGQCEARDILLQWLEGEGNEVLVYESDGRPVGFLRLRREGDVRWLEDLGVSREFRGQGHGRRMIEQVGEYLESLGQYHIYAPVAPGNARALDFYVSCGFSNLNMIELRKDLREVAREHTQRHRGRRFELTWRTDIDPGQG